MSQLVMTVIAIALAAVLVVGGVSYVNVGAAQRLAASQVASGGFRALEQAYVAYRIANRAPPLAVADLLPYAVGGTGAPKAPDGMVWSYGSDVGGPFVCLSGVARSDGDFSGLTRLVDTPSYASSLPASSLTYGRTCGAAGPFAMGEPIAVTYRLAR